MKSALMISGLCGIILFPLLAAAADSRQTVSTEAAFITSDRDRSGDISLDEFRDYIAEAEGLAGNPVSQNFSLMDLNKDNALTLEELEVGEDLQPQNFR